MSRLSAIPGLFASALVLAVATWWLGGAALQPGSGAANVAEISTQAATILILTQWIAIALLTSSSSVGPQQLPTLANVLATTLPLWPLLVLLWLTSRLSITVLFISQLGAILLMMVTVVVARIIAVKTQDAELRQLLSVAAGLPGATLIWMARTPLGNWLSP